MEGEIMFGTVSEVVDVGKLVSETGVGLLEGEVRNGVAEFDVVRGKKELRLDRGTVAGEEEGEVAPVEVRVHGSWALSSDAAARKRVMQASVDQAKKPTPWSTYTERCGTRTAIAVPSPPPPPSINRCGANGALITWASTEGDNRCRVTAFEVELKQARGAMGWTNIYYGIAKTYALTGLSPGMDFVVRVRAVNQLGTSIWSKEAQFTTLRTQVPSAPYKKRRSTVLKTCPPPPPPAPTAPERPVVVTCPPSSTSVVRTLATTPGAPKPPTFTRVTPTSVTIKWSSRRSDNVTSYKLMLDDGHGGRLRRMYEGSATSYKASKLVSSSRYRVAVQAINANGASDYSEVAEVELPVAPPSKPSTAVDELSKDLAFKAKQEATGSVQCLLKKVQQIQVQQILELWSPQTWRWTSVAGVCAAIVAASVVSVY